MSQKIALIICMVAAALHTVVISADPLAAAPTAPAVTITMASSGDLTLDSNAPCRDGPRATYISFRVRNTTSTAQTNLRASISGFSAGMGLAGGQQNEQFVGTLPAGATRTMYWFISYPCTFGLVSDLTVSVTDGTSGTATGTGRITTRNMISSNAGGNLVAAFVGGGAVVGGTATYEVEYSFGNTQAGDQFVLQPAGNTDFNARCFQLIGSEVIASQVTAITVGTRDTQFFTASVSQTGSGYRATMRYFFKYLCADAGTTARPYAFQTSGNTNLKYTGNFGTYLPPAFTPAATGTFTVSKTVSTPALPTGGAVTYTVRITNTSTFTSVIDSIYDVLPAGLTYTGVAAGSQVTEANSSSTPTNGSTGTLVWRSIPGSTYSITGGGTLTLTYTVNVTSTPGQYTNSVRGFSGISTVGTSSALVTVGIADLRTGKAGPTTAIVGDTLRYVLTMTNVGPHQAYNAVLTDTLPSQVRFLSASRGGTLNGRVVTWPGVPLLANGATVTDTVVVVAPLQLSTLTNLAAAVSMTSDPNPTNNNGTAAASRVVTSITGSVLVTPKGLDTPILRLPGTSYSQVFTVENLSGSNGTYDLLLTVDGSGAAPFITIDSITGPGITNKTNLDDIRVLLSARTSTNYTVWYTVASGADAQNVEFLTARYTVDPNQQSQGWAEIRRVTPAISLSKAVNVTGAITPGSDLTYRLQFGNVGSYAARNVTVTDALPTQVIFKLDSITQSLPPGVSTALTFSRDNVNWSYLPVSGGCSAPPGYDACVRHVRWTLSGELPPGSPDSPGTVTFVARIR